MPKGDEGKKADPERELVIEDEDEDSEEVDGEEEEGEEEEEVEEDIRFVRAEPSSRSGETLPSGCILRVSFLRVLCSWTCFQQRPSSSEIKS